jgi:hypothetical protein
MHSKKYTREFESQYTRDIVVAEARKSVGNNERQKRIELVLAGRRQ